MEQNIGIRLEPVLVLYLIIGVAAIKDFERFLLTSSHIVLMLNLTSLKSVNTRGYFHSLNDEFSF
jgi:hypothetical protein